jgi:hypothetical protein
VGLITLLGSSNMIWNEEKRDYDYFQEGQKVKNKVTGQVFTIDYYESNVCGDGCCYGYYVKEHNDSYWPDKLEKL